MFKEIKDKIETFVKILEAIIEKNQKLKNDNLY